MQILNNLINSIKEDAPVNDVRRGLNWTAVLKSVSEGASFMQIKKKGGIRFVTMIRDYDDIVRKLA